MGMNIFGDLFTGVGIFLNKARLDSEGEDFEETQVWYHQAHGTAWWWRWWRWYGDDASRSRRSYEHFDCGCNRSSRWGVSLESLETRKVESFLEVQAAVSKHSRAPLSEARISKTTWSKKKPEGGEWDVSGNNTTLQHFSFNFESKVFFFECFLFITTVDVDLVVEHCSCCEPQAKLEPGACTQVSISCSVRDFFQNWSHKNPNHPSKKEWFWTDWWDFCRYLSSDFLSVDQ